jgi:hypothetical protein
MYESQLWTILVAKKKKKGFGLGIIQIPVD